MRLIDRIMESCMHNWFWRYHFSWLAVLVSGLVAEIGTARWRWPEPVALMYVVLSLSIALSGSRSAFAGATVILAYTFYHFDRYGYIGVLLVAIGAYAIALGGGYLKNRDRRITRQLERMRVIAEINEAKVQFVDGLNGNIEISKQINEALVSIISGEPYLTKNEIIRKLIVIQDWAADLAQRTVGWHKLWEEKREIIEKEA